MRILDIVDTRNKLNDCQATPIIIILDYKRLNFSTFVSDAYMVYIKISRFKSTIHINHSEHKNTSSIAVLINIKKMHAHSKLYEY